MTVNYFRVYFPVLVSFIFCTQTRAQSTTLIDPAVSTTSVLNGSFENATNTLPANGWTVVNGATNKWFCGNQTSCVGTKGAYIGTMANNNNYTISTADISHFYKDIAFPAGQSQITLSFTWKGQGESGWDGLRIYVGSTAVTPVAGTQFIFSDPSAVQVGTSFYCMQAACGNATITLPASIAGSTRRLVFSWQNDAVIGTNPAVTVDNISLISQVPPPPPANDNCAGATPLTPGNSCIATAGTSAWATASTPATTCGGTADDDVWYSFVAANTTQIITVTGSASYDAVLGVFSGTCGALTNLYCRNLTGVGGTETVTAAGLTVGATYYVRVYSWGATVPATTTFNICITNPPTCPGGLGTGVFNVAALPYASGAGTTCGAVNDITGTNVTVCGSSAYYGGEDQVWIFTPASSGQVSINLSSTGSWAGLTLYSGCPFSGGTCVTQAQSSLGNQSLSACLTAGTTYYLILDSWPPPTCNAYSNLTISAPVPPGTCPLGTGAVNIAALPYSSFGRTTCGKVNDFTAANTVVCGSTAYLTGEDEVFVFTPTSSGNITINLTSAGSYTGMMLYAGCPVTGACSGTPGTCVANVQDWTGTKSLCTNVTAGTTYYLIIDSWTPPVCNAYDISISAPSAGFAGTTCGNPVNIAALPYSANGESTACFGNDYNNATPGSCGSLYESGEDKVYQYIASGPECIGVTLSNASTFSIGFQVYSGCPGAGGVCMGSFGGNNPISGTVVLPAAGTYYIMVDTWSAPMNATYDIAITSYGSGPANDLPCNATPLTIGTSMNGDNSCSSGASEPAPPGCWWAGNINTVWYQVVCPASGQLKVNATAGSLLNPQIAVYGGACGALALSGCNDNAILCSGTTNNSELIIVGLTPGATYYIVVDGNGNTTGTFSILASDGSVIAAANNQDCYGAIEVCSSVVTQPNSYFGCGNINDIPALGSFGNPNVNPVCCNSGCQLAGELNVVWYHITIGTSGNLNWTLLPAVNGYYDWSLYPLNGNTCADITNNLVAPVRCNWNATSVGGTGMESPVPGGGSAGNYEPPLAVTAGQQFALHLSNYSGTNGGFTMNFGNSTATIAPTSVTWTGTSNTAWNTAANWGGCAAPVCGMDALVVPATNQPVISVNSTVKNLTITAGATLTLDPGITLTICGNFTNNGTLIFSPTSTVLFNNGSATHTLTGNFTGTNKIGNLTITKTGGSVVLANDLDIGGTLTTSNATSILNTAGKYIKLAGDFNNSSGTTTFTGITGSSTLQFNGTAIQNYKPTMNGGTNITHNNIVMNNTRAGYSDLVLFSDLILGTGGILTLTNGDIVTNAFEVQVMNTANAAVTTGNTNSFVQGNLRRYLAGGATGSFDFPVGHSTKGYQRANLNFQSAASAVAIQLLSRFDAWGGSWSQPGAPGWGPECAATYNMPYLDNGLWTINSNLVSTGTYDITLYNTNYSNAAAGWSVAKSPSATPAWSLQGACMGSCPVTAVQRNGLSGFSKFATIQSSQLLVLPIELISFKGTKNQNYNQLEWQTASEVNSDRFELQSSIDGIDFLTIASKQAAGNSTALLTYSYSDFDFYTPVTYYRLKQFDIGGSHVYSNVVILENKNKEHFIFSELFPNPAKDVVTLKIYLPASGTMTINFTDIAGRVLLTRSIDGKEGDQLIDIDISELAEGSYLTKVNYLSLPAQVKNLQKLN
jgi:hypothetical protein